MADAEVKKRVQKEIQTNVKPASDKAFKGIATAVPDLAKSMKKVSDAIKAKADPDLLQTYRRELVIKVRAVNDARDWALEALDALKKATEDDEDFAADADEVEALQKKLTAARDLLADQVVKAKKLEDGARIAAEAGEKTEKAAHREWDVIITDFDAATSRLESFIKGMRASKAKADAAVKARDAAALKAVKDNFSKVVIDEDVLRGKLLFKRTNEFMSKYDLDTLSRDFIDEMARDRATTINEYDKRSQAMMQEAKKIQDDMDKLAVEPPNAVKATAVLGFKANFIAKVEAALKADPAKLGKALEDIAKLAGVPATGKELLEKLKKAKLL